jgi:hypothetical protein
MTILGGVLAAAGFFCEAAGDYLSLSGDPFRPQSKALLELRYYDASWFLLATGALAFGIGWSLVHLRSEDGLGLGTSRRPARVLFAISFVLAGSVIAAAGLLFSGYADYQLNFLGMALHYPAWSYAAVWDCVGVGIFLWVAGWVTFHWSRIVAGPG